MLKVCRDVFLTDSQKVTLLALLDLSAAFDCVDHDILLHRLQSSSGLAGKVLDWLRSFLTGRSQQVLRDGCLSELVMILFGVPQGSVIGPILFILHMVEVFDIIAAYGVNCHCYASTRCILLPRVQTSTGQRSFAYSSHTVWNSLPPALCENMSLPTFKTKLTRVL